MTPKLVTTRLLVGDFRASVNFYRDVLQMPVRQMIGGDDGPYCEFGGEGGGIALYNRDLAHKIFGLQDAGAQNRVMLTIHAGGVDQAFKELSAKGVKFEVAVTERPDWAIKTAHLRDPDGNLIELFEWIKPG